jgi:hypothetical protein
VTGGFPLEPRSDAIAQPFDGNFASTIAHPAFTRLSPPFRPFGRVLFEEWFTALAAPCTDPCGPNRRRRQHARRTAGLTRRTRDAENEDEAGRASSRYRRFRGVSRDPLSGLVAEERERSAERSTLDDRSRKCYNAGHAIGHPVQVPVLYWSYDGYYHQLPGR